MPLTAAPYPPLARSPFPDGEGKEEAAPPHLLEARLKYAINGSTLSTAGAVPLPQGGRLRNENTAIPETKPSPRGEGAPKGRIGQERYEKERGRSSQVRRLREYPSAAARSPFPDGEGKKEAASPQVKEANPASRGCSLLPLEGGAPKGRRLDGDAAIPRCDP